MSDQKRRQSSTSLGGRKRGRQGFIHTSFQLKKSRVTIDLPRPWVTTLFAIFFIAQAAALPQESRSMLFRVSTRSGSDGIRRSPGAIRDAIDPVAIAPGTDRA